jgi:hypothetical protein
MMQKTKAARRWGDYCRHFFIDGMGLMAEGEGAAKRTRASETGDIDWLAFAVGKLGGPKQAGDKLGVTRQTIYTWLADGLASVPFGMVIKISKLADVPLDYLSRRVGFGDGKLAMALLNRLTHHTPILTTRGGSNRSNKHKTKIPQRSLPADNKKD